MNQDRESKSELASGSVVAVIGGGPAGAFFALHLLKRAAEFGRRLSVMVFERRRSTNLTSNSRCSPSECWRGCNYCAGGISPKLSDVLRELGLKIPEEVVQTRIHSLIIEGFWKNIELEVPAGREMVSVYRGSRPQGLPEPARSFDSFLLDQALKAGANLVPAEVTDVRRLPNGKLEVLHKLSGVSSMKADFVVFATGVNEVMGGSAEHSRMLCALERLLPGFKPPRVRSALIFELEGRPRLPPSLRDSIHFVEYGSRLLRLEMCSLVPKRRHVTVTLVGLSVDSAARHDQMPNLVKQFLDLPHVRKVVAPGLHLETVCMCRPNMVVGSARRPFGDRVAAAGDMVTARLYKDGILSAERTARSLAEAALTRGIDRGSLAEGYEPILRHFRLNNRVAGLVFLLHRLFFSSSVLSRVLYQAIISERKTTVAERRRLERILWRIASGDDEYTAILRSMIHPRTCWSVLGGALETLRNYLTELLFGLDWERIGRFTTGVAVERLEEKRQQFARLLQSASIRAPRKADFERMYTIKIAAPREMILEQLGKFGERDRQYLRPRWLQVTRIGGEPNTPGCIIQYQVVNRHLTFSLELEQLSNGHMAVYRVRDGFARGGILIFEIEPLAENWCALSIYVAFDFARGRSVFSRSGWWAFRALFPAFVHDVLWNHSLCEMKDKVEAVYMEALDTSVQRR